MSARRNSRIAQLIDRHEKDLLAGWMERQLRSVATRRDLSDDTELREQSRQFLRLLRDASAAGAEDGQGPEWTAIHDLLASISTSRARQGFTPSETATFVF